MKREKNGAWNVNKGWADESASKNYDKQEGCTTAHTFGEAWAYKMTRIFRLEEGRRFVSASECQTYMKWGDVGEPSTYILTKKHTVYFQSTPTNNPSSADWHR